MALKRQSKKSWSRYKSDQFYDELLSASGNPRVIARNIVNTFKAFSPQEISDLRDHAELTIRDMGISFTVYSEGKNIDRSWPFDLIPRVITAGEWKRVSKGLKQRLKALNCFIDDIYNKQKILKDGIVPADVVLESDDFELISFSNFLRTVYKKCNFIFILWYASWCTYTQ